MSKRPWPVDPFTVSVKQPASSPLPAGETRRAGGPSPDLPRASDLRPQGDGDGSGRTDLTALARGGALSLGGSVASSVLGFLLVVFITRAIHPARSAGVLFEAIALFMILANTTELGADTGLVRMVARYRALGRTQDVRPTLSVALWPVLVMGTLAGAAMYAYAPQLAHWFIREANRDAAVTYLRLFAPFLPMATATTVILSGTRGFGTMVPYVAIQNVGVPLLRPLLIPAVVAAGLGIQAVALAWAVPVALGFVVALITLYRLLRRVERTDPRQPGPSRRLGDLTSEFWRFSAARGLAGFFMTAVIWLDILLVGALRSTGEAGVYSATSRLVGVGTFALQALGVAIAPQVAALLANKQNDRANSVFQTGSWWLMVLAWPVYITMAVFAPFLLRIFGRDYVAGQTALTILSVAMLFLVGTGNNKIVLLMGGGSGWNLGITASSLAVNIVMNVILIPRYGMNGAAVAYAASIVVDNLATTAVVWGRMKLNPFGSGYPVVLVGALVCYGVLGMAVRTTIGMRMTTFIGFAVVSSVLYVAMLWAFRNTLRLPVLRAALRVRGRGRLDVDTLPVEPA